MTNTSFKLVARIWSLVI